MIIIIGKNSVTRASAVRSVCRKTDGDKIRASYENGVLKVEIPKKEEVKPKPARLIEIS